MTMIEKMARAICEADGNNPDQEQMTKLGLLPLWTLFKPHVRAALASILEPSEGMLQAGTDQLEFDSDGGLLGGTKEAVDRAFAAMIQAALEEKDA